jgi:hypothetical protein
LLSWEHHWDATLIVRGHYHCGVRPPERRTTSRYITGGERRGLGRRSKKYGPWLDTL